MRKKVVRSKQNKVPNNLNSLYTPILHLKTMLQSGVSELNGEEIVNGLALLHFTTFLIPKLQSECGLKHLIIREIVEQLTKNDSCVVHQEEIGKISSFIDNLGKILNTNLMPIIYIAIYQAYLDAEIYKHFHSELGIYDFHYFSSDMINSMKIYHDASVALINETTKTN